MLRFDDGGSAEKDLVSRVRKDDPEGIKQFYCNYLVPIAVRVVRRFAACEVEAEELANVAFLHLCEDDWRRLKTWDGQNLPGWLWIVCSNLFFKMVKGSSRTVPLNDQPESRFALEAPELDELVQKEAWFRIMEAIEQLKSPRDRFVLRSIYLEERERSAIAAELNIPIGTLHVITSRALKKLRNILIGKGPDEDASNA
jgi:RNA polymerase sigma factor (sigma-70 family)